MAWVAFSTVYASAPVQQTDFQLDTQSVLELQAFSTVTLTPIEIGKSYNQQKIEEAQEKEAERQRLASLKPKVINTDSQIVSLAQKLTIERFGEAEWYAMDKLIMKESGYNPHALNRSSGACGIPQALPCSKLPQGINTSAEDQIKWMLEYIAQRYGNPSLALSFHVLHNWY